MPLICNTILSRSDVARMTRILRASERCNRAGTGVPVPLHMGLACRSATVRSFWFSLRLYLHVKNLYIVSDRPEELVSGVHLWLVLMKAHRAIEQRASASIESLGLCLSDFAILEILLHKGPLPVNAIGARIPLTSGSTTTAVDRLEKRGLVRRESDAEDRRARVVHLTVPGRRLIEDAFSRHSADLESATAGLTEREKATLIRLLRKLGISAEAETTEGE